MTDKQRRFADEYLIDCNATQAAIRAGYSKNHAHTNANRLLQIAAVKEYIDGPTVFELIRDGISVDKYLIQVRKMACLAKKAGLNIDYFPTNFVVQKDMIYYVDYECNPYMDEWSFENWGIKYWSRTAEFEEYLNNKG